MIIEKNTRTTSRKLMSTNVGERLAAMEAEVKNLSQSFAEFKGNISAALEKGNGCMEKLNGRLREVEASKSGLSIGSQLLYKTLLVIVAVGNIVMIVRSFLR